MVTQDVSHTFGGCRRCAWLAQIELERRVANSEALSGGEDFPAATNDHPVWRQVANLVNHQPVVTDPEPRQLWHDFAVFAGFVGQSNEAAKTGADAGREIIDRERLSG